MAYRVVYAAPLNLEILETQMSSAAFTRSLTEIEQRLASASSYTDWKAAAMEHDQLSGKESWKHVQECDSYDHVDIARRLSELQGLRVAGDNIGLLFALNEGIHGNMGGMGKNALHEVAKFGTKQLIVDYIDELTGSLEHVAVIPDSVVTRADRLDFFKRASHCLGRSALMLSGAGSLVHFHSGVTKTLFEQGLLPTVISGSSGGAVIAGVLGTNSDDELRSFFSAGALGIISSNAFEEQKSRSRRPKIAEADVHRMLAEVVPDMTFQEAWEKTGRMINITVATVEEHQISRLMNAITSPNVFVRSAILASCAVPGVFQPVTLMAKNVHGDPQAYLPGSRWVDGAVTDDLPAKRLARLYGVNHYMVSMANPVALALIKSDDLWPGPRALKKVWRHANQEWLRVSEQFSRRYLGGAPDVSKALNIFYSLYGQEYTGDINIMPSFRLVDPRKVLGHLTAAEIEELDWEGQRATWPLVEQIRLSTQIDRTLDGILNRHDGHDARRHY
jgi:TAG lipase / steryl ester hydrolase / phospholipase A2 / LPA acyltransferase